VGIFISAAARIRDPRIILAGEQIDVLNPFAGGRGILVGLGIIQSAPFDVQSYIAFKPEFSLFAARLAAVQLAVLFVPINLMSRQPAVRLEARAQGGVGRVQLRARHLGRRGADVD
jgi:hypothetical protein